MIEVKNIYKGFYHGKEFTNVLNNISFTVLDGSFLFIMGPSGSGKTTLLNIMSGIESPDKGEVYFDGGLINDFKEKAKADFRKNKVSFVFQDFKLIEELTVYQNVLLAKRIKKSSDDISKLLDSVGLLEYKNYLARDLSGGMKQRVNIARALVNNPQYLFADEPTGSLDSKNGLEIMKIFKEINKHGVTIVMVTHQMENTKFGNRVINLLDGVISEI